MEFCRNLPKLELHAHLNGSVSASTLSKIIKNKQMTDLLDLDVNHFMAQGNNLQSVFDIFSLIYRVINDLESVRVLTLDVIQEFAEDNVKYLELRTTLRPKQQSGFEKEDYLHVVLDSIDQALLAFPDIRVKLIVSVDRRSTLADAFETVELAQKHRGRGIVGIDLCGDPTKGSWAELKPAFERARELGFKICLHAAEVVNYEEAREMILFRPDRLGHATFLTPELQDLVSVYQIPLELCLSSNVKSQTVSSHVDHHFRIWYGKGHPLSLCTDDKGVFSCSLSSEYEDVGHHFSLSPADLFSLSLKSIDQIFADDLTKETLRQQWLAAKEQFLQ